MVVWWVLFGLAMIGGLGSAVAALRADRRPKDDEARQTIDAWPMGVAPLGLLSGGPVRAVDARITDFVERGLVRADAGKLIVVAEIDDIVDASVHSARERGLGPDDVRLLRAVREHGGGGLDAIRRRAPTGGLSTLFGQLARQGLLVSPLRRRYGPMKVAYPVLLAFLPWFVGVLTLGVETTGDFENLGALSLFGWFGVPVAGAYIYARKTGYRGPNPASSLGRAVLAQLRAELPSDAGQARRVALGGFEAMTAEDMRVAIQGSEPDSRWSMPERSGDDYNVNAALARATGVFDADGGDGGDGGD